MATANKYKGKAGKPANQEKPVSKQATKQQTREHKLVYTPAPKQKKERGPITGITFYYEDGSVRVVNPHESFQPQYLEGLGASIGRGAKVVNTIVTRS